MKSTLLALASVFAFSAQAESYYCKLENVPAVKQALAAALESVAAKELGVAVTGEVQQVAVKGMGDAFDFWGTDLLFFKLDGLALDNRLSVGVRVTYNSLMAAEYVLAEGEGAPTFTCADTGEINPEVIYIDGESANEEKIIATPAVY